MRRVWPLLWIALGVALVVRTGIRDRGVITDHLEFGRRVLCGLELYAPFEGKPLHPPYPPGFGLLTAPFSLLPERAARFGWGALQVVSLLLVGLWSRLALLRCEPALRGRLHLALLLTAVVASRYVLRDTHGGGGNLINLALVLSSLTLAERGRQGAAGWLLGFSLATKPTQVLVVPLLALFGHRRAAAWSVVAAAAFTGASLLSLRQGLQPLEHWLAGSWAYATMQDVFAEPAMGFPPFTWMNQCLRCAVARYLGEVPAEYAAQVPWFFGGLGLDSGATAWITRLLGLALLGATAAVAWSRRHDRPWLVAAVLCLSLLLFPISWKAHHVALIPALFLLVVHGLSGRRWVWWFVGAYALLCVLGEELTGKDLKQVQQSLYLVTAGTAALWLCCLGCARRAPESPALPGEPPGPRTFARRQHFQPGRRRLVQDAAAREARRRCASAQRESAVGRRAGGRRCADPGRLRRDAALSRRRDPDNLPASMGLACGIVGLPNVGKTTIFGAITEQEVERSDYMFSTTGPVQGTVNVPDDRLERIAQYIPTQKVVPAQMTVVDIPGLVSGSTRGEGMGISFLGAIKDSDVLLHVVRCFEKPGVQHVGGALDPATDAEVVDLELGQVDLGTIERNIERLGKKARTGDKDARATIDVLEHAREALSGGEPLRRHAWTAAQRRALQPLFLLTLKPMLFVANVGDDDPEGRSDHVRALRAYGESTGCEVLVLCGDIEAELVRMDEAERAVFMQELELRESGLHKLIHAGFGLLGLQTFFTAGEKEVRAWVAHRGDTAPVAAGAIHTDFREKFIRAEVYTFDDLMEHRSEAAIKAAGKMRVEGKEYVVEDGDICHFLIGK